MKKTRFINAVADIYASSKTLNLFIFIGFAIFFTVLLASKYFLFQNIIDKDGISKVEIIADRDIEVVDVYKTTQKRKEAAQKIEPILITAEDSHITGSLNTLFASIQQIRAKKIPNPEKREELATLFDISDVYSRNFLIDFLMNTTNESLNSIIKKTEKTLESVLKNGVSEKDFEKENVAKIIYKNLDTTATKSQMRVILIIIEQVITPNMVVDEKATELAQKNAVNSVSSSVVTFKKGDRIVFVGEPVTRIKRDALYKAGFSVLEINYKGIVGIFCLVSIGIVCVIYYLQYFEKQFLTRNYLSIIALLATLIGICAVILSPSLSVCFLPFPAFVILLSIFTNPRVALTTSLILITIIFISLQFSMEAMSIFVLISIITSISSAKIKYSRRFDLIKTGFEISLGFLLIILSIYLLKISLGNIDTNLLLSDTCAGVFNGIFSGIVVLGILPLLESTFKIITPYGLAELADHNQPLLKRLQLEAPGTFSHSLMVSNLCEAAAEAVGADPILARVGAFYHDIGKLKRPLFFVENQTYFGIENPHQKLNPRLSKMVITAHPKDGVDLAKEYKIPPVVQNFILQHHGDSLTSYFYNQALQQEGQENVAEEQFRYSCPKPNTKETAILMLADAVESASRTLKDGSQEELDNLINKIITERLNDGQLSDSPLTLKDLKAISASFNRFIRAAHHQRIKYHENIIEELKDKGAAPKIVTTSQLTDTELEDKIEKKIQKRQIKNKKLD